MRVVDPHISTPSCCGRGEARVYGVARGRAPGPTVEYASGAFPARDHGTGSERGSALLLVAGATAAVGVLVAALLTAAFIAYETAALRHDGMQARLLAESALDMLGVEIARRQVRLPTAAGDSVVWQGQPPAPPAGFAAPSARSGEPCGFRARLETVPSAAGVRYELTPDGPGGLLVDVLAEGFCGRGYAALAARFAVTADRSVVRLY